MPTRHQPELVWERRFELPTIVAALAVLPTLVIEESGIGGSLSMVAAVANWCIWLTFVAETATLLTLTSKRWRWIRRHPLDVLIVVLTPPFLPAALQSTRVLRLLRLSRLAVTASSLRKLFSMEGLKFATVLAVFGVIGSGSLFSAVEPDQHLTTWDGIWWAMTTVTTVGYGDIYPHTTGGRIVAIGLMVGGIGFVAIITGAVANMFVRSVDRTTTHAEKDILARMDQLSAQATGMQEQLQTLVAAVGARGDETTHADTVESH